MAARDHKRAFLYQAPRYVRPLYGARCKVLRIRYRAGIRRLDIACVDVGGNDGRFCVTPLANSRNRYVKDRTDLLL
jgi:hypothetical protein